MIFADASLSLILCRAYIFYSRDRRDRQVRRAVTAESIGKHVIAVAAAALECLPPIGVPTQVIIIYEMRAVNVKR
jgi:hypothetical protein